MKICYNRKGIIAMQDKIFFSEQDYKQGCICIWIDEIVSCLKDTITGELKETVVFKIESRKYLNMFREENGWQIDWRRIPTDVEIYALALKDNNEIQGLVAIRNDINSSAAYIHWACTAPHNNKSETGSQRYSGVDTIYLLLRQISRCNGDMREHCMVLQLMKNYLIII